MTDLHKYGKAQCFRTIGCINYEITWIEKSRFPNCVNEYFPLKTTNFERINDNSMLSEAYEKGKKYYSINNIIINLED